MGMYDELICSAPLPGDPPEFVSKPGHRFQTKDLDCRMNLYEITADGRLVARENRQGLAVADPTDHDGDLHFHAGNVVMSGPEGRYTRDGEDAEWVEYRARFDRGTLLGIEESGRERYPALPAPERWPPAPSAEGVAEAGRRRAESLVGRTLFVLRGGSTPAEGHPTEIVAEGPHEWVGRKPDGRMEVFDRRWARDNHLFDSAEAASAAYDAAREEVGRKKREYQERLAARTEDRR